LIDDSLREEPAVLVEGGKMVLNRYPISNPFLQNRNMENIMNLGLRGESQLVCYRTNPLDNSVRAIELRRKLQITPLVN
jgi:hypothetical protein